MGRNKFHTDVILDIQITKTDVSFIRPALHNPYSVPHILAKAYRLFLKHKVVSVCTLSLLIY